MRIAHDSEDNRNAWKISPAPTTKPQSPGIELNQRLPGRSAMSHPAQSDAVNSPSISKTASPRPTSQGSNAARKITPRPSGRALG